MRRPAGTLVLGLLLMGPSARAQDVVQWKPAHVSSPMFESNPAFDPKTGDLYFVRSTQRFLRWRILVSACTDSGWSEPAPPTFAGNGDEADPCFADGGRILYFISTRSQKGVRQRAFDIWKVERDEKGAWGDAVRLLEPVNSSGNEWFPQPAPDGSLYLGSDRPFGLGQNDIWRAREGEHGTWTVEDLGDNINSAGNEYEALPSPDGKSLIIMADGGFFEATMTPTGWSPRAKLPPQINTGADAFVVGPLFSPSGKTLLFSRDTKSPESGEFFVWHRNGAEDWPPACPGKSNAR